MTPPSKAYVIFTSVNPPGKPVRVLLGDGVPNVSVDGGWQVVKRPKWVGFTDWVGVEPHTMTVPVLFDGFEKDKSIEVDLERLRQMMRPATIPTDQAPVIRLEGSIPMANLHWVITGLAEGDVTRRRDGQRIRSFQTVSLLEYVEANVLVLTRTSPAAAAQARSAAPVSAKTYMVRAGDTLPTIAGRVLGDSARWTEIASMNEIRDPNSIKAGILLRLP